MSAFGSISMLGSALRSFQYGLDVTSNNISNAATVGYSRQVVNLDPTMPIQDGQLWLGTGVNATSVSRIRDLFLDAQIRTQISQVGRASVRETALTELAAIFPEVASPAATNGLKGAIDNAVAAWTSLSAAPTSIAAQTAVSTSLKALAGILQTDARQTFDLQVKLDDQVKSTVIQINALSDQIATLNSQIKLSAGRNQAPGSLLDQREQAAEKLAKLIDANFTIVADGSLVVSFNGGLLADGSQAKHLALISSTTDPGRTAIGYFLSGQGAPVNVTAQITGGQLGGLLQTRDGEVETARQSLNRMAFGIISRSNEVNRTFVAGDGTTSHNLFSGTSAADIVLDPIVAGNPAYVGGTRDALAPGDLAKMQAQLKSFIQFSSMRTGALASLSGGGPNIDPTLALNAQIFSAAPTASTVPGSGQMVISTSGNAVTVAWDTTQSLNQIIRNINAGAAGAFYATFDETAQKFILVGQTPLTVYDVAGNLADVLKISSSVTSSAPINNYPVPAGPTTLQVDPFAALNSTQNTLDLYTSPTATGGTVLVDGNAVNWTTADQIGISLFFGIQGATPTPGQVSLFWNPATQTVELEKSGDPFGANTGSHDFSIGNTMTSIQVVDKVGNLTRTLNLDTNTNSSKIMDELVVTVGANKDAETALKTQAQALVDQTQQLQDSESKVDLNQELAQARLYQRSYEASVRLQGILDEMLNVLINHTGSPSSGGTAI